MITKQINITCKFCSKVIGNIEVNDVKATMNQEVATLESEFNRNKAILVELDDPANTVGMMPSEISNKKEAINKQNFDIKSRIMTTQHDILMLPTEDSKDSLESHNINDSRCDECTEENGTLKDEIQAEEQKIIDDTKAKADSEPIISEEIENKEK